MAKPNNFNKPEPASREEKAEVANEAMGGGKSKSNHPGKLHRLEIEQLDKGYKVSAHRRSSLPAQNKKGGKGGMHEPVPAYDNPEYQHHRTESAFNSKGAMVSHVMSHLADCDNDAD